MHKPNAKSSLIRYTRILRVELYKLRSCVRHVGIPMCQWRLVDSKCCVLLPIITPPAKSEPSGRWHDSNRPRRKPRVDLKPSKVLALRPIGGGRPKLVVDSLRH